MKKDRHYDRQGNPISISEWSRLFGDRDYQQLAITKGCGKMVSTIWIGVDHNFSADGPPIIFESMVFGDDESGEVESLRYSTEEEAFRGHERLCSIHARVLDQIVASLEEADAAVDDPDG